MMRQEEISIELINRKIEEKLSEKEEKIFSAWLKEKDEHRRYFERLQGLYNEYQAQEISIEDINSDWENLKRRILISRQKTKRIRLYRISAAAAIIVFFSLWAVLDTLKEKQVSSVLEVARIIEPGCKSALLELADGSVYQLGKNVYQLQEKSGNCISVDTLGLNYQSFNLNKVQVVEFNKLFIPKGGEYQIILEDGTKVWLNSDTYLRYPASFVGNKREIYLEGEAFFEVKHDSLRPFIIYSGAQKVEVLGTSFGITCYNNLEEQFTTLVAGAVKIEFATRKSEIYHLTPGKQLVYNKSNKEVEERAVDVTEYVSWKDGKYIFKRKNLDEILTTLSRWYDFKVFYSNSDAKEVLFSGELKRFENFNSILGLIEKTSDVQFLVKGNVVNVIKTK